MGTAALAVFLGAPDYVQDEVTDWAVIATRRDPQMIDPKEAWERAVGAYLRHQIRTSARGDVARQEELTHYVSRILDPELTPPPGDKQSDRERPDGGAGNKARRRA